MFPKNITLKNLQSELEKNTESYTWRPLRIINIYRIFIALALSVLFVLLNRNESFDAIHNNLFFVTGYFYLTFAFISAVAVMRRFPRFRVQLFTQTIVDITAFTILIFAKNPTDGTLGVLLIIAVTGNCMLMTRRLSIAFAALASLCLLGQQTLAIWYGYSTIEGYSFIAVICISVFITALAANTISRHAKEFEALAKKRGIDLDNLAQVNEHIVSRMQFGVIVLDSEDKIHLMNNAAENILGISGFEKTHVKNISSTLFEVLQKWRGAPVSAPIPFESLKTNALARFVSLGTESDKSLLIFIEDEAEVTQRVQDAKLASLGQLTASIAHEIRNPLGAISHAGQLLAESEGLSNEDKRLTEIIANHSERLNSIIRSILHLSKKNRTFTESIVISDWIEKFIYDFSLEQNISQTELYFSNSIGDNASVQIDPSHLQQVLWNLCKNAINHSQDQGSPKIIIKFHNNDSVPVLEIINKGDRIPPEAEEKLFEPFFTTSNRGTGLGLFLSKELCSNNGARLQYINNHPEGTCFRITFSGINNG